MSAFANLSITGCVPMPAFAVALFFLLAPLGAPLCAETATPWYSPPSGSEVQLFIENDMLSNTDRYYTNGIKLGVGLPFELLQSPAAEVLRQLDPHDGEDVHVGLFLGQNLYTPRDIEMTRAQPLDRPWAAWLYLGGVAQRARANRLDTVEFDVGMVGPAALGEPVQKAWHRLVDTHEPRGWQHQIRNEPAFMFSYLHKRRFGTDRVDLILNGGGSLGTVMTQARVGAMLRVGGRLNGFGPDTIEPGGAMLHSTRAVGAQRFAGLSWSLFAGVDHRLVAHNIFLDGSLFRAGPSVESRRHVRDYSLGFALRVDTLRFSWTRVARSAEFRSPGAAAQRFDSFNIGMEF